MRPRFRQIIAWVLLLAFCNMAGTKAFHHHHWKAAEDIVCPLDGIAMSHHTLAHTILDSFDEEDDECAICHFIITKVVIPTAQTFFYESQKHFIHHSALLSCNIPNIQGVSLLRAPPINWQ